MMGTMTKVIGGVQSDGDDSMWLELLAVSIPVEVASKPLG